MNAPGVAFALRFDNECGFVQQFFAKQRDLVARELRDVARCLLVFRKLGNNPVYSPRWATEAQTDFYDYSRDNRERIKQFICENKIVLVVFQGASLGEIDLKFLHRLGVRTINTEDVSFDQMRTQPVVLATAKYLLRNILKMQVHDLHIANSQNQYNFLRKFACLPADRLRAIPCGIDTEYFSPGDRLAACTKLGLDPATTWIMAASQSRPEKRVDRLIRAVKRVKETRPLSRVGFFYVGDGQLLPQWQEFARNILPASECLFFGRQVDLRPFYQAALMFIHGASKESFGLVIAEAMGSGLPVVATRADGPSEIIQDGVSGYLIDRDNWDAFVAAILHYIDHPQLGPTHGEMGRQRCLERYNSDREASQLADLIRPFLAQASAPASLTQAMVSN